MSYPTMEQVQAAGVGGLLGWNRQLPSPSDEAERVVMDRIVVRLAEERERDPGAYVAASKALGW